jgi:hypothetical protein
VCGITLQRITLTFNARSCTAKFTSFPTLSSSLTYSCAAANPFQNAVCGSFLGSLVITLGLDFPAGPSTLAQTYLSSLGLANINWVQNLLIGHDFWTGATLQPTLLPNLAYIDGIFGVTAFVEQLANIIGPITGGFSSSQLGGASPDTQSVDVTDLALHITPSRYGLPGVTVPVTGLGISGLPGQAALQGVGNLMTVFGTSFTDMASFRSLRCVGTMWLSDNPTLTTLSGLGLAAAPAGGLIYDSTTDALKGLTVAGLQPLLPIAKCAAAVSGNEEVINMALAQCAITSWNQICRYASGAPSPCP